MNLGWKFFVEFCRKATKKAPTTNTKTKTKEKTTTDEALVIL